MENNPTGSGCGIKLSEKDRNEYFEREWTFVILELK